MDNLQPILPRITKVLQVEPFTITVLWTTSEVRTIDFEPLFTQWKDQGDTRLLPLMDYATFQQVAISPTRTLYWPNVLVSVPLRNRVISGPLDLDPDVLYEQSKLVKKTEKIPVGILLKKAREEAGLSQLELALKSGTTRHYISRIENGKSDIQLETLNKIVQLGMGKEVRVEIR
ncbi:helix-turn-helix protein [Larkinella arboricola]|uniref:Helix-turn-helix protein n=1 Tax=Larkinella arboricola TaxID=643671 RepID=A0A327WJ06_LARAB|nr:helix-turn-helix transcriptional regulator [Larkinella arboricola]RAJ90053.1 helix-turn-helix protein [Larkinella arboricola]